MRERVQPDSGGRECRRCPRCRAQRLASRRRLSFATILRAVAPEADERRSAGGALTRRRGRPGGVAKTQARRESTSAALESPVDCAVMCPRDICAARTARRSESDPHEFALPRAYTSLLGRDPKGMDP